MPIGLVYILFNVRRSTLKKANVESLWGKLYDDIKLDSRANLVHWPYFVIRRLVYVQTSFWLNEHGAQQVQVLVLLCLISLVYFGKYMPMKTRKKNRIEWINDNLVDLLTLHMFCFSDWVPDMETQYMVGFSMIAIIALMILINMGLVFGEFLRVVRLVFMKYMNRFKAKFPTKKEIYLSAPESF